MCKTKRNPKHCFLPPYMLDKLKKSKDKDTADAATRSIEISKKIRLDRKYFSSRKPKVLEMFLEKAEDPAILRPNIEVYDCNHTMDMPGIFMNKDFGDADHINVKRNLEIAWKYYFDLFGRNSFNGKGAKVITSIHYAMQYNNAHWDGRQLVFGEGDGKIFKSFTLDIDLVAHEFSHGVSPVQVALDYAGESGALDESFSDVMGSLVKQRYMNSDVNNSSWLMGENVLMDPKYAIRSLKEPGAAYTNHPIFGDDPQPKEFEPGIRVQDVHKFSGIPNHAFYVAAFNIGGNAWERAGQIWYGAYMELTNFKTNFGMFREATIKKATDLFPGGPEIQAVKDGWDAVKVKE